MKCSFCDKTAVYYNKVSKLAYCRAHFMEYFEKRVRKTIRKYGMISKDDHVLVAVSGGKDSMSLLHLMLKLKKSIPKLEITALLIDEGIRGYRENTIPNLLRYAENKPVKYLIASFKDYVGESLDEIVRISFEKKLPYMPCSYCGVFRRYVMNAVAREIGATVIATAHNLDDIVQTFVMNLVSNSWDRIFALTPVRQTTGEDIVKRIRPFYEIPEKEVAVYALLNNLVKPEFVQCPYVRYNIRFYIRKMLNELEDKYPGAKYGLLRSLMEITSIAGEKRKSFYKKCAVCGNSASHTLCRACIFRAQLGLMKREDLEKAIEASKSDPAVAKELKEYRVLA
ncbi:MAG: TIGR00269 family protein [Desulfurococcaceae archaeon]